MSGGVKKTLIDTGPLLSAIDSDDAAHVIAAPIVARLQHEAVIPTPVLVEVDHLVSRRVGCAASRSFLRTIAGGKRQISYMSGSLVRRAIELDHQYSDLDLGFVDSCVMAIAERHDLSILTFDFRDFRATESNAGPWRLALDEHTYQQMVRQ